MTMTSSLKADNGITAFSDFFGGGNPSNPPPRAKAARGALAGTALAL